MKKKLGSQRTFLKPNQMRAIPTGCLDVQSEETTVSEREFLITADQEMERERETVGVVNEATPMTVGLDHRWVGIGRRYANEAHGGVSLPWRPMAGTHCPALGMQMRRGDAIVLVDRTLRTTLGSAAAEGRLRMAGIGSALR